MIKLTIPQDVFDKVMHWVDKSDKEVSGFGTVVRDGGQLRVTNAYLLQQEVGSAHTDIEASALTKLMYKCRNDEGDLKWWWHSHVRMDVFWSSQDKDTILELGGQGWCVATVFNQMREMRTAVSWKSQGEFGASTTFRDSVDTSIELNVSQETLDSWDKEFDECVKEKAYDSWKDKQWDYELGEWKKPTVNPLKDVKSSDYRYGWEEGLLGDGITCADEAEALDMPLEEYLMVLNGSNEKVIESMDEELAAMWMQGYFDKTLLKLAEKDKAAGLQDKKKEKKDVGATNRSFNPAARSHPTRRA